jgi:hypothetical protein
MIVAKFVRPATDADRMVATRVEHPHVTIVQLIRVGKHRIRPKNRQLATGSKRLQTATNRQPAA